MTEQNPLPGRITHRLNLDSEEEQQRQEQQRLERQQYERQKQQKRQRKQEKKRAKEQQEKAAKEQAQRKADQRKKQVQKYNDLSKMFKPDSDSEVQFSRLKRKIQQMYPRFSKNRKEQQSSQQQQESDQEQNQSQSQEDSQSNSEDEEESSQKKRQKKSKNSKRRRNQSDDEEPQKRKAKNSVKVQPQMSAKDKLVQEVAVRWSYALPEWPPVDFDYEAQLKKRGYRSVQFAKFKFVDEVVNGLTKVYQLDGFRGVYRGKIGLIDVRPKQDCPSLNYFYSKSQQYLNSILRKALEKQVQILENLQFKQNGQQKLIQDLRRRLKELVR